MASLPTYTIDMRAPPARRWEPIRGLRGPIQELTHQYVRDLGGLAPHRQQLEMFRDAAVRDEYVEEIDVIASYAQLDPLAVLLGNVYYDAFKLVIGCTAFAIDGPEGPLHARNLDWWTERSALRRHSCVFRWLGGRTPVEVVSWPGFVGTFSGVARGRFAVTLNAVLSDEPAVIAPPVGFQLREVLLDARDYEDAVSILAKTTLPSDSLLLLSGPENGQMCVIERSPTRSELRQPSDGVVVATNDYRLLTTDGVGPGPLAQTTSGRFEVCGGRARTERPKRFGVVPGDPERPLDTYEHHGSTDGVVCEARPAGRRLIPVIDRPGGSQKS